MNDVVFRTRPSDARPYARTSTENVMLLEEALARSRQQEAEEAARRYRQAREVTAGRLWSRLAAYAARRAERARRTG
ncbi:MAG: hypothetical protein OJJ54_05055 [Pseudonocardia sp.]|nr:hypothetical protein [Pseudonocardia sp.]